MKQKYDLLQRDIIYLFIYFIYLFIYRNYSIDNIFLYIIEIISQFFNFLFPI